MTTAIRAWVLHPSGFESQLGQFFFELDISLFLRLPFFLEKRQLPKWQRCILRSLFFQAHLKLRFCEFLFDLFRHGFKLDTKNSRFVSFSKLSQFLSLKFIFGTFARFLILLPDHVKYLAWKLKKLISTEEMSFFAIAV